MRKISILIFCLLSSIYSFCQNKETYTASSNDIEKIQIEAVDFSILTFITVECTNFEKHFPDYRTLNIEDKQTINKFLGQIENLEQVSSDYSLSVDTRAKMEIYTETGISTVCIGNLTLYLNGIYYKTPEKLIELIESLQELRE
jgi:hypothetical protein